MRLDTLQLDLGVIGPAAGGEFVQNNFHTLIGVSPSYGWANQLHNEPTVGLSFERRWRTGPSVLIDNPKLEVDFIPRAALALGNVATYASVGGTARIGKNLRDDFGPTRARPALPGSDAFIGDGSFGWYLFAGLDGQAVARNIFLDGNTDGFSQRVWHRPFVGEASGGPGDSLWRRAHLLHADSAHAGVLRARPDHPVRLGQPHLPLLTGRSRKGARPHKRGARRRPFVCGEGRYMRPINNRMITMMSTRPMPPLG